MTRYKIFLAFSDELKELYIEIGVALAKLNKKWFEQGIYLDLVDWKSLLQTFRPNGERIQDYFNRKMLECHIVIALFYKKVGRFTKEEFNLAYEHLKKGDKPYFLFVYFKEKNLNVNITDAESLRIEELKLEIQEYQQIYDSFTNNEDLLLKLQQQLELAISELNIVQTNSSPNEEKKKRKELEIYKNHMFQKFRFLDFIGLNAILLKPLELENVFIKLRVRKSFPLKNTNRIIIQDQADINEDIEYDVEDYEFIKLFGNLIDKKQKEQLSLKILLLGNPGSGKTTLMKWIALQCLKLDSEINFSRWLPVFIKLKDLHGTQGFTFLNKNLEQLIIEFLKRENISSELFAVSFLKEGKFLFLFDGLDEIGNEKNRREVIDWIQKQNFYQNALIVTSRFSGLDDAKGIYFREDIPVFEIQNFKMNDVEKFLCQWYQNIEIAVTGRLDHKKTIGYGEKKYIELIKILKDNRYKNLKDLAVNPLLLTIIAIVNRTGAMLPINRYKLYEACLKVIIDTWNSANKKIYSNFSFDHSMVYLSLIAKQLMENSCREIDIKDVEECLPELINGSPRRTFLNEMVLKSGILYESEGKCGFIHLTFQEYLTAFYFSKLENQNEILKFQSNDYWQEVFKLFVNVGISSIFFKEISENLIEKNYWKQMRLWNECLIELSSIPEEKKKDIECNFARNILNILLKLDYYKDNEPMIVMLYKHYPLSKYASEFVEEGWKMFYYAKHPFVRSIGSTILSKVDLETKVKLIKELKIGINKFSKYKGGGKNRLLNFLFKYNNCFSILLSGNNTRNLKFVLEKLKCPNTFIKYIVSLNLRHCDILFKNFELRDYFFRIGIQDISYLQYQFDYLDPVDIRELVSDYQKKYKTILQAHQFNIKDYADWVIQNWNHSVDKKSLNKNGLKANSYGEFYDSKEIFEAPLLDLEKKIEHIQRRNFILLGVIISFVLFICCLMAYMYSGYFRNPVKNFSLSNTLPSPNDIINNKEKLNTETILSFNQLDPKISQIIGMNFSKIQLKFSGIKTVLKTGFSTIIIELTQTGEVKSVDIPGIVIDPCEKMEELKLSLIQTIKNFNFPPPTIGGKPENVKVGIPLKVSKTSNKIVFELQR